MDEEHSLELVVPSSLDEHLDEVMEMLRGGWQPRAIVRTIRNQYGIDLPIEPLVQLRLDTESDYDPLERVLPGGVIANVLSDMHRMYTLQKRRLAEALAQRDVNADDDTERAMWDVKVSQEMAWCWKMARDLRTELENAGIHQHRQELANAPTQSQQDAMPVREILARAQQFRKLTLREVEIERD